jgi:hypothetical protein
VSAPAGAELARLSAEDQAERRPHPAPGTEAYRALRRRDAERRARVRALLAAGTVGTPDGLYRAALVLQHGDTAADAHDAYCLAACAADRGHRPARWLSAAAYDRWRMYRGLPQRYGTQIVPDGRGHRLWDVEPATTDAERQVWDVPPLADAPPWLRAALRRWEAERSG